jgi:hypothetical protein
MRAQTFLLTITVVICWAALTLGQDRLLEIPAEDFQRLYSAIKPQPGESPWREIPWLTDITEARRRAIAEDKPLVVFTAADGSPLART